MKLEHARDPRELYKKEFVKNAQRQYGDVHTNDFVEYSCGCAIPTLTDKWEQTHVVARARPDPAWIKPKSLNILEYEE